MILPEEAPPASTPGVAILYRDEVLVAVHKPSGLPVHRSERVGLRAPALVQLLHAALGRYVYPVHRLDRQASGVMVLALTPEAARDLCEQFRQQEARKTYLAVVRGWPEPPSGVIDHPVPSSRNGCPQPAQTEYRRLACTEVALPCGPYAASRYALLELQPRTGRQHQLRRHLKHISHPILGDTEYGDGRHNRLFRREFGLHRLLLQAVRLEIRHPVTGRPLCLECAPEPELVRLFPDAIGPVPQPGASCRGPFTPAAAP